MLSAHLAKIKESSTRNDKKMLFDAMPDIAKFLSKHAVIVGRNKPVFLNLYRFRPCDNPGPDYILSFC